MDLKDLFGMKVINVMWLYFSVVMKVDMGDLVWCKIMKLVCNCCLGLVLKWMVGFVLWWVGLSVVRKVCNNERLLLYF